MASCSFKLKGWTITIITATLGFIFAKDLAQNEELIILGIIFIFVLIFWYLDSFYLQQERMFRGTYDEVRNKEESQINFSMGFSDVTKNKNKRWSVFIYFVFVA
ncbi:hypothetical protein [Psychrilyobacter atlanticus]|uniref:hypothetical protein n=1 Tax=Psychrilyobacter atlanticus TaxID=271091 RepID=UPI000420B86F|nr:hypothetical protein [Psychrilyobacter atlanticus]